MQRHTSLNFEEKSYFILNSFWYVNILQQDPGIRQSADNPAHHLNHSHVVTI